MLTNDSIKKYCDKSYNIRGDYDGIHQISISDKFIRANFEYGYIYIKYAGFPVDEHGYMDFEDTANSNFEKYIEACLKYDIIESLLLQEVGGVSSLLPIYQQEKRFYKTQTSQELKFKTLNFKNTMNKINLSNASDFAWKSMDKRYLR
jgi:hypothetical protein